MTVYRTQRAWRKRATLRTDQLLKEYPMDTEKIQSIARNYKTVNAFKAACRAGLFDTLVVAEKAAVQRELRSKEFSRQYIASLQNSQHVSALGD